MCSDRPGERVLTLPGIRKRASSKPGSPRVESRSAAADLYERQLGSTTRVLFSRCISYLFIGGTARFWRAHARTSRSTVFSLFFRDARRFERRGGLETVARDPTRSEKVGSRSEGGSDAGASTEPRQGAGRAGALRCLPIASSSASTVSSLCHLPDLLLPRGRRPLCSLPLTPAIPLVSDTRTDHVQTFHEKMFGWGSYSCVMWSFQLHHPDSSLSLKRKLIFFV